MFALFAQLQLIALFLLDYRKVPENSSYYGLPSQTTVCAYQAHIHSVIRVDNICVSFN